MSTDRLPLCLPQKAVSAASRVGKRRPAEAKV